MTKRQDSINALRELAPDALDDYLRAQRRKLFEIRLQQATGQVDDVRQIREIHKEIARTMTLQIQAQRAAAATLVGAGSDKGATA